MQGIQLARSAAWLACATLGASSVRAQATVHVSLSSLGDVAWGDCYTFAISGNGRFVTFESEAFNLVPGDTNDLKDVFVHDRWTHVTTRENVRPGGAQSGWSADAGSLSFDGRFVVFVSADPALVPDIGSGGIILRDRQSGTNALASVSSTGVPADVSYFQPSVTPDGRFVGFLTHSGLLAADDTNLGPDAYVRDTLLGTTERASLGVGNVQSSVGCNGYALSDDGRYVAFAAPAAGMAPGFSGSHYQVFLRDRTTGTTRVVSKTPTGAQPDAPSAVYPAHKFSADGNLLLYGSLATTIDPADTTTLQDAYLYELATDHSRCVSFAPGGAPASSSVLGVELSADGRFVAVASSANNLIAGDTNGMIDAFVLDVATGSYQRVSVSSTGEQSQHPASGAKLSSDGTTAAFQSYGSDLVSGMQSPFFYQIFVHDLPAESVATYCMAKINSLACRPVISATGTSSLSGPDTLCLTATNLLNKKSGLFVWSTAPAALPFHDAILCVAPPLVRTTVQNSVGHFGVPDCSGSYAFHFSHAYAASEGVTAGDHVYGQFWSRDTGFAAPNNFGLTDAVDVALLP